MFPYPLLFLKQRAVFLAKSLSFVLIRLSALLIFRISKISIIKWTAFDLVIRVRCEERTGDLNLILPLQGSAGSPEKAIPSF